MFSARTFLSWLAYSITGCGLILLNKQIGTAFNERFMLLFVQTAGTCLFGWLLSRCVSQNSKLEEFAVRSLCSEDIPGFIASAVVLSLKVATSFLALVYINTATYSVFKNVCVIGTAMLEWAVYGEKPTPVSWICFAGIAGAGALYYHGDLEFSGAGYALMFTNKVLEVVYPVLQRWLISKSLCNQKGTCTFWTNAMAAAIFLYFSAFSCEQNALVASVRDSHPANLIQVFVSVVFSFGISLATFFFIDAAGGTAFSFAGAVNKVPIVLIGVWLFDSKVSRNGYIAVVISLAACFLYTWERTRNKDLKHPQHTRLPTTDEEMAELQMEELLGDSEEDDEENGTIIVSVENTKKKKSSSNNNNNNGDNINNNSNINNISNNINSNSSNVNDQEIIVSSK